MAKESNKQQSMDLFSNNAIKGKSYLDIDRVIFGEELRDKNLNNNQNKR
ncbi:hypothetical protein [Oceanobacillus halophilus]|nr:hypothetical protein [Oceanobacillus halophilus]